QHSVKQGGISSTSFVGGLELNRRDASKGWRTVLKNPSKLRIEREVSQDRIKRFPLFSQISHMLLNDNSPPLTLKRRPFSSRRKMYLGVKGFSKFDLLESRDNYYNYQKLELPLGHVRYLVSWYHTWLTCEIVVKLELSLPDPSDTWTAVSSSLCFRDDK
ncbi:hypothetical protein K0M31_010117, partial [Melipona bicolor]